MRTILRFSSATGGQIRVMVVLLLILLLGSAASAMHLGLYFYELAGMQKMDEHPQIALNHVAQRYR